MGQKFLASAALALVLAGPATLADAETRVALVIGNGNYLHAPPLANPENDADSIASALRRAEFAVSEFKDLNSDAFRDAILDFGERAAQSDVAVVYYAGHGVQAEGLNYLIPIDAVLDSPAGLKLRAVDASTILEAVSRAHRLRLLILDACRDNPFKAQLAARGVRGIGERGLAPIAPEDASDTVIAYSAKENTEALDGRGANSPFATALARHLDEKGVELSKMFREVRSDVLAETGGTQEPGFYDSRGGGGDFYFMPGGTIVINPAPTVDRETVLWQSVSASNDIGQLQSYLDQYPNGTYAGAARAKIAALSEARVTKTDQQLASIPRVPLPASVAGRWQASGGRGQADFGGAPYANYRTTLTDVRMDLEFGSGGEIVSGTASALATEEVVTRNTGSIPPNTHTFTLRSADAANGRITLAFDGGTSNQPPSVGRFEGRLEPDGRHIIGTFTVRRNDEAAVTPQVLWEISIPLVLARQ